MDKWSSRIRLLFLLTILFIWFFIREIVENNVFYALFWIIFTLIYVISLTILYLLVKKSEK